MRKTQVVFQSEGPLAKRAATDEYCDEEEDCVPSFYNVLNVQCHIVSSCICLILNCIYPYLSRIGSNPKGEYAQIAGVENAHERLTLTKPKQLTPHLFLPMADRHFFVCFDIYYNTEFNPSNSWLFTSNLDIHLLSNHTMWAI